MLTAAAAERIERALGALDSAGRRMPAGPAGMVIAVLSDLDAARTELSAVLGRPTPAPAGDEDDGTLPDIEGGEG